MKTTKLFSALTEHRLEDSRRDQPPATKSPRTGKRPYLKTDSAPAVESRWKRYLTEFDVSEITGRSLSALRKDRHYGRGIPYIKLGRQVRYSFDDVDRFMESCRIQTRVF